MVALTDQLPLRTHVPSQRSRKTRQKGKKIQEKFYGITQKCLEELRKLEWMRKRKFISTAWYIYQWLRIQVGAAPWYAATINTEEFQREHDIPSRTFQYALKVLSEDGLIRQEGRGLIIKLYWNPLPHEDTENAQSIARNQQPIAPSEQPVTHNQQSVAQVEAESIDMIGFHESFKYTNITNSSNEAEEEEFKEFRPEEEVWPKEPVHNFKDEEVEQTISFSTEDGQKETQEQPHPDEDSFSAPAATANLKSECDSSEAAGKKLAHTDDEQDPREKWLRQKAPTLKKPIAPENLDRWVRAQLQPANWQKWQADYQASTASAPKFEPIPDGLLEKIDELRKRVPGQEHCFAQRYDLGGRIVVETFYGQMTAVEFMVKPIEEMLPQTKPVAGFNPISGVLAGLIQKQESRKQRELGKKLIEDSGLGF